MRLKTGQQAPDFNLSDVLGKPVQLFSSKSRFSLVVFFRYAGCPWCNLAVHRLVLEYELLRKYDCQVVAFIQSEPENIITNIYKRHSKKPQFPIIADPNLSIYKQYAVEVTAAALPKSLTKIPHWVHAVRKQGFKQAKLDGSFFIVPASFLISNSTRKIIKAHYGTSYYDTDSFIDIYEPLLFGDDRKQ